MRRNHVKRILQQGGTSLGTMVFEFNSTGIGQLAAGAGAEYVIYDMEHTGWTTGDIRSLLANTRATNLIPMVRVPATEYHFIARVLDLGAMGIMVPMVESSEQARKIVASAKYPPIGRRGAAYGVAHDDYQLGDPAEKMCSANDEVLLIAQIETVQGVEHVDEIAATDGIDVLWIGGADLTSSLGIPGQYQNPQFLRAIERVVEAGNEHKCAVAYLVFGIEEGKARLKQGFRMIAYGGDIWLYQQALRQGLEALR